MNACGAVGLALYNYGQTVSIPFFTDNWRPDSWLARIRENSKLGLHTLCLLDIKVKEQSEEKLKIAEFEETGFVVQVEGLVYGTSAEDVQVS